MGGSRIGRHTVGVLRPRLSRVCVRVGLGGAAGLRGWVGGVVWCVEIFIVDASIFVVFFVCVCCVWAKLRRAIGGCLGTKSR